MTDVDTESGKWKKGSLDLRVQHTTPKLILIVSWVCKKLSPAVKVFSFRSGLELKTSEHGVKM